MVTLGYLLFAIDCLTTVKMSWAHKLCTYAQMFLHISLVKGCSGCLLPGNISCNAFYRVNPQTSIGGIADDEVSGESEDDMRSLTFSIRGS